jgi:RimJ/RimL family protein N-acetyltransferase
MPGPVFLRAEGVDLRTIEREDLDFLQRCRNDPSVRTRFPASTPQNASTIETDFEERLSDDESVDLLVVPTDEDEAVGFVKLFAIDGTHGIAELGAYVAPEAQGNGYATAAARRLVRFAFEERRLERLEANALADNGASRAVIENVGFVEEGRQRSALFVGGGRVDRVNYGLLRGEWRTQEESEDR